MSDMQNCALVDLFTHDQYYKGCHKMAGTVMQIITACQMPFGKKNHLSNGLTSMESNINIITDQSTDVIYPFH